MENNKEYEIINACEKVMNGLDDENIAPSNACSLCRKIARLVNDESSSLWLEYECSGYPRNPDGHIETNAFNIAFNHGRGSYIEGNKRIFTELAFELEHRIEASKEAIKAFSTSGASASGDHAMVALKAFETGVHNSVTMYVNESAVFARRLEILKNEYYKYASSVYITFKFSKLTTKIFDDYREEINSFLIENMPSSKFKLQAIEENISNDNPEKYSQVVSSCRRLLQDFSEKAFTLVMPGFKLNEYTCKNGKKLKIDNEKYKNKLFAIIDMISMSQENLNLNGSDVLDTVNYIEKLNDLNCKGVHSDITKLELKNCIIRTYVLIGSTIAIYKKYLKKSEIK